MTAEAENIVLVSIDSLRADHCGFLGDDRGLTPTMDALAGDGVSFETAVAPGPQTFSSMPATFTGHRASSRDIATYPGQSHWERRLAAIDDHLGTYASLAERLQDRGYETAGFSPNPWTSSASGFDRGFDVFRDFSEGTSRGRLRSLAAQLPGLNTDSKPVELALDMFTGSSFFARWTSFYDELDAVRERLSEPYFVWVFLLDTHYPFLPGPAHRTEQTRIGAYLSALRSESAMRGDEPRLTPGVRESVQASYRDTVRSVDAFLDRLWTDVAGDDPALLVHSDHGESFGEHGNYGHHHRELYEENVHVPYFVHNAESTVDVPAPTSLATIPEVALSIATSGRFDPQSLPSGSAVATSEGGENRAVRGRRFKYHESGHQGSLFDLREDPSEATDIADLRPDERLRCRKRLQRFERQRAETAGLSRAAESLVATNAL